MATEACLRVSQIWSSAVIEPLFGIDMNREHPESTDVHPKSPDTQSMVTAHVIELSELEQPDSKGRQSVGHDAKAPLMSALTASLHPLRHLKTRLTVSVGGVELTVGDLMSAKENQVIQLDTTVDEPVDVLLEGHVVARGILVAVDEHFAVRITEVPVASDASHDTQPQN